MREASPGIVEFRGPEEADLVEGCRSGAPDAWAQVYRLHAPRLARFLHLLVWSRDDVDDLVQQVFVTAFDAIRHFRGESLLSTWLFGIATHVAERHLRSVRRRRTHLDLLGAWEAAAGRAAPDSADAADARDRLRRLVEVVDGLDFRYRTAWTLHEVEGMDVPAIATVMRAPPNTVRTWLFRARHRILDRLAAGPAGAGEDDHGGL